MSSENQTATLDGVKRLLPYFKPQKLFIAVGIVSLCIFSLVDAGMIYFIKPLIDDGLNQANSDVLRWAALFIILVFLIRGIASFCASYCMAYAGTRITYELRQQLFVKYQYLPQHFFDQQQSGHLIAKVTYDTEQVSQALLDAFVVLIRESVIVCVLLAMMFYASWQLSLIFLIIGPAIAMLIKYVSKRFRKISKALQNAMGDITKATEQAISGHQEIVLNQSEQRLIEQFAHTNNKNRHQAMKLAATSAQSNPVVQWLASLAIAAVLLLASVDSILSTLTTGTFTLVLIAIGSLLKPLKKLTTINPKIQRGLVAANSIFELLDHPIQANTGKLPFPAQFESLNIQNLNFSYGINSSTVLHQLNVRFEAGKTYALVGASGSGKSTLAKLLTRLYDAPDQQMYINNQAIAEYQLYSLRQAFSYVSQNIVLIDDTIANNITFGCHQPISEQMLKQVIDDANLTSLIAQLPQGLNSQIGENGKQLSGGQRQRIAIARAMLRNTPIIIFDEATSALDNHSEAQIQQAIKRLAKDKTVIIIAHRLSTIVDADEILVMEQGQVVEQGDHQTLLKNQGSYHQLFYQQAS
ncbi:lipid A export permease/ATP-binding protein MsbA [Thalassotalea marina]|uniref:Lipid A export ATP-binding/permease protein MsbA n=1 Tax=Thalassotalea marina TaxID=1673741 RepID=A0A919EH79_9GAMM|nr:lipid A export permease/ATP-binding protein MsbA [Thalassotalea marina]GHF77841.1 lipid A export ATP-binding/permease protein MsbA [Thalassotalea marina]